MKCALRELALVSQDLRRLHARWLHFKNMVVKNLLRVFLVLPCLLMGCATTPPQNPENICSVYKEKPRWHNVATRAEEKWGTSMHMVMAIMYQESAFVDDIRPPRRKLLGFIPWKRPSSAYGYSQALVGTWASYQKDTGEGWRERDDFADATDFIHWYLQQSLRRNGLSRDDAYSLYLTYHEGWGGFSKGTYKPKSWLLRVAEKVDRRTKEYAIQYGGCQEELKRKGFLQRWLGFSS